MFFNLGKFINNDENSSAAWNVYDLATLKPEALSEKQLKFLNTFTQHQSLAHVHPCLEQIRMCLLLLLDMVNAQDKQSKTGLIDNMQMVK